MNNSNCFKHRNQTIRNQGFTLIELMISISILTLLLFTGAYSYSLMSDRWNKELGQFAHSAKNYKHLELVQRLLEGVQPYVVVDSNQKPSFFFVGGSDSLLAVSRSGLLSGEYPEVFRLSSIDKGNGKIDLIYQSLSTENILLKNTEQEIDFTHRLVLFENIDHVNFQYRGWLNLLTKNSTNQVTKKPRWFKQFSGIDTQLMPEKFKVVLTRDNTELGFSVQLEAKPERWVSAYLLEKQ